MLLRLQRYSIVFCGLLVVMLTTQAGAHGYVLCFGEDGHVAVEIGAYDSCGPVAQGPIWDVPAAEGGLLEDEHHLPCLDVPAVYETVLTRNDLHFELQSPPPLLLAPFKIDYPVVSFFSRSRSFTREPLHVSQTLRAHRTVVLLN